MLFFEQIYKANFPTIKKPLQIIVYNFLEKNYRAKLKIMKQRSSFPDKTR